MLRVQAAAAGPNRFRVYRHTILSCLVFFLFYRLGGRLTALDLRTSSGGGVSFGSKASRFRPRDHYKIAFRYNILIVLYITRINYSFIF